MAAGRPGGRRWKREESRSVERHGAAPLLPADVRDPVVLVVSEVVTNTVAADAAVGAVDDIEVELVVDPAGRHAALAVTDGAATGRGPRRPSLADEDGGRGLLLLDTLSYDHGWTPRTCGKCVWALFRCPVPAQRWTVSSPERLECADV